MEAYADLAHHPVENLSFDVAAPKLSQEQSVLLQRLKLQHEQLSQLIRKFRHSLDAILQGGVMPRDELEHQGRDFIALQREHIDLEEREAFPMLDQVLDEQDWERVAEKMPPHDDPVFGTPDTLRFQNLFQYLLEHGNE